MLKKEREERDRAERELEKSIARSNKEIEKKNIDEQMKFKQSRLLNYIVSIVFYNKIISKRYNDPKEHFFMVK